MSHCIVKPIDKVLSLKPCWHGLEEIKEVINAEVLREAGIFFDVLKESTVSFRSKEGEADGANLLQELQEVSELSGKTGSTKKQLDDKLRSIAERITVFPGRATVIGDLSSVRPDLVEMGQETRIPFAVPKDSYGVISNERIFKTLQDAFGSDVTVVTAGTLNGGKVFFTSLDIGETLCKGPRGDEFQQYLEAVSSHDGTIGTQFFDSGTRMVCMNTVRAALHSKGNLDMVVYHTKNAEANLSKVSVDLADILAGRRAYFDTLGSLDAVSISKERARYLATAFLATWNLRGDDERPSEISTRLYNVVEEITHLFERGQGNRGATLYDLYNGVTECYTHGKGVPGKDMTEAERFMKGRDGTANDIKQAILPFLNRMEDALNEDAALGEKLFKEKEAALLK